MSDKQPTYTIHRAKGRPHLDGNWNAEEWKVADTLEIANFHPESSDHRPKTQARVLYSDVGLHLIFRVEDRYVYSVTTDYHGPVWKDACVESFVQPKTDKGYFNFEMNCGGTLLLSYAEDADPNKEGYDKSTSVPKDIAARIEIFHSMPDTVDPEIADPVEWRNEYLVPYDIFETYVGPLGALKGQTWRGNFYKCAEINSHPHWATWAPIGEKLDFHQPQFFAPLIFD